MIEQTWANESSKEWVVRQINIFTAGSLAIVLCLLAPYAVAENSAVPQQLPDNSLLVYAKPQRLIKLSDGRKIHLFCLGHGSPTVILSAGLGDWVADWRTVHVSIAQKTRVCAWDRAGWGYSDPSPAPQDVGHTTSDLEEAIRNSQISDPYVLVGHSLGAFESLLLADRQSRLIRGMVLIDPGFPDEFNRLTIMTPNFASLVSANQAESVASLKFCADEFRRGVVKIGSPDPDQCLYYPPSYPGPLKEALIRFDIDPARVMTEASLIEQLHHSYKIVINKQRNYGDMPLIILSATNHTEDTPAGSSPKAVAELPLYEIEMRAAHDAMAALSTEGVNRVVDGATHYIQNTRPDVVIAAVNEVIDNARNTRRLDSHQP